jgi:hypothetical protein
MPTIASANVPAPKSWDEFEDIVLAAAKLRWNSTDFFRNGRQGQAQNGVDVWGHDDDGRHIGIQCKNTIGTIKLSSVKEEVANAELFEKSSTASTLPQPQSAMSRCKGLFGSFLRSAARRDCSRSICYSGMTSAKTWRKMRMLSFDITQTEARR